MIAKTGYSRIHGVHLGALMDFSKSRKTLEVRIHNATRFIDYFMQYDHYSINFYILYSNILFGLKLDSLYFIAGYFNTKLNTMIFNFS